MPFGLKNAGATYKRAMTTIFHDMIHKEIEVYVDDVIIKSRKQSDHVKHLRKFFQRLRRYNIKLNPTKCAFGVPSGKLLGFIVSRRVIELDPSKIKAIQELPLPRNKTEVISLLGRLNYISRFIAQLTTTCEPILKLLKKDDTVKWTDECQEAFNKIKEYLSNPLVLVPSKPGRPLVLYLTVLDNSFGCVLGQHDITGWKEQAIYYLSKKFTSYEILLTEFDIVYVTRTAMKAQALADYLAGNPVDEEYEPLKTYFPDEEVMHIDEFEKDEKYGWKLFFDGDANMKGFGIGVVLISEIGHHYAVTAQLRFYCTNNMAEYKACILGLRLDVDMGVQEVLALGDSDLSDLCQRFRSVEFRHIPRIYNEVADVLATLALMLHHLDKAYIDPLHIQIHDQHVYCNMVEEELDGEPWFHDIRENIKSGMVKFEWDRQEIIVHGEENLCAHSDAFVLFIETEDDKGPWVYQVSEIVSVEKVPKGKYIPTPKIAYASIMVASEMLRNGFVPGKGLGASLQGIVQPVSLPKNLGTFGIRFKPTVVDVKRVKRLKHKAWALPKPILRLSRSFVKPGARKHPVSAVPSPVVDIDEELIERF
ncbi:uncharacterized protein [Nicotiana sylvestris]|uniref:uncharacterized protein n=1 Tax=Nicotiana sylvestris TaxID=4096 RepID=UPI00388CA452